jgi:diguanylate cyclase (GGDEF)-like protein
VLGCAIETIRERALNAFLTKRMGFAALKMVAVCALQSIAAATVIAAVTAEDVLRAESRDYGSHRKQMSYAIKLVEALDDNTPHDVVLDVLSLQAQSWIDMGLADRLERVLNAARTLAISVNDPMRIATIKHLTARASYFSGQDRAAIPESEAALAAQRALGGDGSKHPDPTRLFRQLLDHVNMLQGVALDVETVPSLRLAERILPQVRNPINYAIDLDYAYASLLLVLGDRESSMSRLRGGLDKAVQTGETGWIAELHGALATLHLENGDFVEAITAAKKYRELALADGSSLGEATAETRLAEAFLGEGRFDEAATSSKRAIEIYDRLDDSFSRADARRIHAYIAAQRGDVRSARDLLSQSLEFRPENTSMNWSYLIARVRTAIAVASRDPIGAREAMIEENKRALARDNFNRTIQTRTLREYHEVNAREVQLEAMRKESEVREAEMRRDQLRILRQRVAIVTSLLLLLIVAGALAYFFKRSRALRRAAETDALTGIYSRAAILARAEAVCMAARESGRSMAACVIDIDQFKRFNDLHGHATGDRVLTQCVEVMRHNVRLSDAVGRIGGDEFLIVMDDIDEAHAVATANRILAALRVTAMGEFNEHLHATISAGVAAFKPTSGDSAKNLIRNADAALLRAKNNGKDRVVAYGSIMETG